MQVMLQVIRGPSAGKEFKLPVDNFVIGRGDGCHLKPKSDMVSRKHCALAVRDSKLFLEDFGSKNGTYVNGERVEGTIELKMGDELRVGPLDFLILIDHTLGAAKRSKVSSVKEAASRVAEASGLGNDVASWLEEADEEERQMRMENPETRQFRVDETRTVSLDELRELEEEEAAAGDMKDGKTKTGLLGMFGSKKKTYGKLPQVENAGSKDSQAAANDAIRRLMDNRR
ncbi:FHA domain-containing protein FhaB [Bremerella volcania]|uniref:FHA domain-containing protein FhaB n=1 Tax=Bremerella volcania TaxID=2527984 RepID=A0A518C4E8_9BACT|nr:FHA domain-containing protein [Bremerella volcania]QDU74081.1 FHA domain-containing protein FhaB [Bremerella volcania]